MIHRAMNYRIAVPVAVLLVLVGVARIDPLFALAASDVLVGVVAGVFFFVCVLSLRWTRNDLLFCLGAGYVWVAIGGVVQALIYRGVGLPAAESANLASQYWVMTRFLEVGVLLTAPVYLYQRSQPLTVFLSFGVAFVALIAVVQSGLLPDAYVAGQGVTLAKRITEGVAIFLLAATLGGYSVRRQLLPASLFRMLALAIGLSLCAEVALAFQTDVLGPAAEIGHLLKLLSVWVLFLAAEKPLVTVPLQDMLKDSHILRALGDPVLLVDRAGRVLHVNKAARRAYGLESEELPDHLHEIGPLRAMPLSDCPICRAVREGRHLRNLEVHDKTLGVWHSVNIVPAKDDADQMVFSLQIRDVTATKRLQHMVREEKQRADMALANSQLATWDWDVPSGRVAFSDNMMTMLGYHPGDWKPHVRSWACLIHPDDEDAVGAALQSHLDGEAESFDMVHRMRRKDGTYAWTRDMGRVVERDDDGGPRRVIGTQADVTGAKELELSLQRSNQDLEQFAYAVSHDLQEPLRMIGGFLGVLRRRYREDLPTEAREFVDHAVDGAERMESMIRDLLEVSRVQTKGGSFSRLNLGVAIDAAQANLIAAIKETGAEVSVVTPLPDVLADESQIVRLFQNLIGNALKYRRPDVPPRIDIVWWRVGEMAEVEIADNGVGIPEDQRERVFQPFQRLHGRDVPGTGIGLTLCRRIVDRHGGVIAAGGNDAGGTTITFTLPIVVARSPLDPVDD